MISGMKNINDTNPCNNSSNTTSNIGTSSSLSSSSVQYRQQETLNRAEQLKTKIYYLSGEIPQGEVVLRRPRTAHFNLNASQDNNNINNNISTNTHSSSTSSKQSGNNILSSNSSGNSTNRGKHMVSSSSLSRPLSATRSMNHDHNNDDNNSTISDNRGNYNGNTSSSSSSSLSNRSETGTIRINTYNIDPLGLTRPSGFIAKAFRRAEPPTNTRPHQPLWSSSSISSSSSTTTGNNVNSHSSHSMDNRNRGVSSMNNNINTNISNRDNNINMGTYATTGGSMYDDVGYGQYSMADIADQAMKRKGLPVTSLSSTSSLYSEDSGPAYSLHSHLPAQENPNNSRCSNRFGAPFSSSADHLSSSAREEAMSRLPRYKITGDSYVLKPK